MKYNEEQIQKILELKEAIIERMAKNQEELEILEKELFELIDRVVKNSSFTKASALPRTEEQNKITEEKTKPESIPIKKNKNGEIIANAFVTPEQISIILNENIGLTDEIPPLRTFFLDRIIGEMKKTDSNDVRDGKIDENSVIDCIINKNGPSIREIIIKNYREKERLNEIINTATWSLTRMLENSVK